MAVLAFLLCCAGAADAHGTFRCKGRIIDRGATMAQVLSLCGPSSNQVIETLPVRAGTTTGFSRFIGYTTTQQWVYDRGWGRFPAVVIFRDGVVRRIEYLPYRSGDE